MDRELEIARYCIDQGFPLGSCSSINSIKATTAHDAILWADQTMLDKVCDWLLNNADNYVMMKGCGCYYNNIGLVNGLRQIMEE